MAPILEISLSTQLAVWNGQALKLSQDQFLCLAHAAYRYKQAGEHYRPRKHAVSAEELQEYGVFKGCQPSSLRPTVSRTRRVINAQAPLLCDLSGLNSSHFALDADVVKKVQFAGDLEEMARLLGYAPQEACPPLSAQESMDLALLEAQIEAGQVHLAQGRLELHLRETSPSSPLIVLHWLDLLLRCHELTGEVSSIPEIARRARELLPQLQPPGESHLLVQVMQAKALRLQHSVSAALQVTQTLRSESASTHLQVRTELLHGVLLLEQSEPEFYPATRCFEKALELARQLRWWWGVQAAAKNLGRLHYLRARLAVSPWREEALKQSLEAFRRAYAFSEELRMGSLDPEALLLLIVLHDELDRERPTQVAFPLSRQTLLTRAMERTLELPAGPRRSALEDEIRLLGGGGT